MSLDPRDWSPELRAAAKHYNSLDSEDEKAAFCAGEAGKILMQGFGEHFLSKKLLDECKPSNIHKKLKIIEGKIAKRKNNG